MAGRRIALIGNAPELLDYRYGPTIDADLAWNPALEECVSAPLYDFVIRMNTAPTMCLLNRLHKQADLGQVIGKKMDCLSAGSLGPTALIPPVDWIWWSKHTRSGDKEKARVLQAPQLIEHGTRLFHAPKWLSEECAHRLGANPSAAVLWFYMLTEYCEIPLLDLFGITAWGELEKGRRTSWTTGKKVVAHNPRKEAEFYLDRGLMNVSPCRWRWIPSTG